MLFKDGEDREEACEKLAFWKEWVKMLGLEAGGVGSVL